MNDDANRWQALIAYLYDETLEIDHHLAENVIRPLAGRIIYLDISLVLHLWIHYKI